jgi:hypothetical protein
MAQQIQKGVTFSTYPGTNSQVTADLINHHVDDAILLPGAISSQPATASPLPASELLVLNSTTTALNKVSIQNIVQNSAPVATSGTKGVVSVGAGLSVTTEGVLSAVGTVASANGTSGTATLAISATAAGGTLVINGSALTGFTFLSVGSAYTVTLAPGSSGLTNSNYSFIFGARQVVSGITTTTFQITITNIPYTIDAATLTGCYIELIGTAGIVTPSTGDGIKVVQQTVGSGTQPVMKLVPATKASIGGVIAGNNIDIDSNGVITTNVAGPVAKAVFSGIFADVTTVTGTYVKSISLSTVTMTLANHGFQVGHLMYVDFTTGPATDSFFKVIQVSDANTFTVTQAGGSNGTGNFTIRKCAVYSSAGIHSIVYGGVAANNAIYYVNLINSYTNAIYTPLVSASNISSPPTNTFINVILALVDRAGLNSQCPRSNNSFAFTTCIPGTTVDCGYRSGVVIFT